LGALAWARVLINVLLFRAAVEAGSASGWWGEATATGIWATAAGPTSGFGWRFRQSVAGGWWFGWTLLAGTFLASWLSVLRATGYRFVRRRLTA
jgi:hypothetical protein